MEIWKNKANTKTITRADMVTYCALRATSQEHFNALMNAALTPGSLRPDRPTTYHYRDIAKKEALFESRYRKTILGQSIDKFTEEQIERVRAYL